MPKVTVSRKGGIQTFHSNCCVLCGFALTSHPLVIASWSSVLIERAQRSDKCRLDNLQKFLTYENTQGCHVREEKSQCVLQLKPQALRVQRLQTRGSWQCGAMASPSLSRGLLLPYAHICVASGEWVPADSGCSASLGSWPLPAV